MPKKLRVGIMGAGWAGRSHAEGFAALRDVTVCAVAEPDAERRAALAAKYKGMLQYDDYHDMIREAELDIAAVALPTGMHSRACTEVLQAGLHVICEKPPTTTAAEMVRLARLAEQRHLTYMFCRQPRFTPRLQAARRAVASGRLGRVYFAESRWIRCRGIPWGAGGWFVNRAKGGGVLLDLGIHAIDNAWFVMGTPRPVEVMAGLYCAFSHLAPKGVDYTAEDAAVAMIRFADGATLQIVVTFALNTAAGKSLEQDGRARDEWQDVRIFGDKAGMDTGQAKLILGRRDHVLVRSLRLPRAAPPAFVAQSRDFVRALRAGREPTNSARQAVMLMQMLDGLRKSGDTGRAVRLSPPS